MKKSLLVFGGYAAFVAAIAGGVWLALPEIIDRQVKHECAVLEAHSKESSFFWLTPSQKKICDEAGIIIHAPVKTAEQVEKEFRQMVREGEKIEKTLSEKRRGDYF